MLCFENYMFNWKGHIPYGLDLNQVSAHRQVCVLGLGIVSACTGNLHTNGFLPFKKALLYTRSLKLKILKEWDK